MRQAQLRRLLLAPELIVVDLAVAALEALRRGILLEHPTLSEPPLPGDAPVLRRAELVLRSVARLRRHLRAYRRAVDQLADATERDDLPF